MIVYLIVSVMRHVSRRQEGGCLGIHVVGSKLEGNQADEQKPYTHSDLKNQPHTSPKVSRYPREHDGELCAIGVIGFAEEFIVCDVPNDEKDIHYPNE